MSDEDGDDCGAMVSGKVVDLGRYRRGLELLSLAAEAGARGVPVEALGLECGFGGEVVTETKEGGGPRGLTVRLSAEQVETLARLGPILTEQRPDLAALNGGVLSPYAVLRIAVGYGLRVLEAETTRRAADLAAEAAAAAAGVGKRSASAKPRRAEDVTERIVVPVRKDET
jgi:hypothetical protein